MARLKGFKWAMMAFQVGEPQEKSIRPERTEEEEAATGTAELMHFQA